MIKDKLIEHCIQVREDLMRRVLAIDLFVKEYTGFIVVPEINTSNINDIPPEISAPPEEIKKKLDPVSVNTDASIPCAAAEASKVEVAIVKSKIRQWTKEEDDMVKAMARGEKSLIEVQNAVDNRTISAIYQRITTLKEKQQKQEKPRVESAARQSQYF